jgi:membrane-bound lytic murein transglycosylase C
LYCAICAYNTGAGNVAKVFVGSTNINKASSLINKMSPNEVYRNLLTKLPYLETRKYLKKVNDRRLKYASMLK